MENPDDIWSKIGDLPEEEMIHVLTKLFLTYENLLKNSPNNQEAINFFRNLDNAVTQANQCNLNRR